MRFLLWVTLGASLSLVFITGGVPAFAMNKQVLRIAVAGQITSLDPHFVDLTSNNALAAHIFDRLVIRDENAGLKLSLAESWRVIDATTWEFNLRKDVRFHDGSSLSAEDVVASLERVHEMKDSPGSFSTYLRGIRSIQIMDEFRFRIRTHMPYPLLLNDLSTLYIVSKRLRTSSSEELESGKNIIGSGPYRFVAWRNRDQIELARHEEYWGEKASWPRVLIRIMNDNDSRVNALLGQEVDLIDNVPPESVLTLTEHRLTKKTEITSGRLIFLHMDTLRGISPFVTNKEGQAISNPLRDPRVRRALSIAIDRNQLQTQLLGGLALPTRNLVPAGSIGHHPGLVADSFDLAAARRLMAEAGYPGGFAIVLHGPNNHYLNDVLILRAIAQMWVRLGLNVKIDLLPIRELLARGAKREFSISLLGWNAVTGEASSPLRALLMTSSPEQGTGEFNWGGYSNAYLDSMVDQALRTIDTRRRDGSLQQAVKIALQDDALIPLYHSVSVWAMRRDLEYAPRADEHTLAYLVKPLRPDP